MSNYSAFHIRDARSLSLKILTFCITTMVETVAETEQTHLFMFGDGQFRLIHCFTVVQQSSIQCLTSFTNFSILEKIKNNKKIKKREKKKKLVINGIMLKKNKNNNIKLQIDFQNKDTTSFFSHFFSYTYIFYDVHHFFVVVFVYDCIMSM